MQKRIRILHKKQVREISRTLYTGDAENASDESRDSFTASEPVHVSTAELAEFFKNDLDMFSAQKCETSDAYHIQRECAEEALSSMGYIFCPSDADENGIEYIRMAYPAYYHAKCAGAGDEDISRHNDQLANENLGSYEFGN